MAKVINRLNKFHVYIFRSTVSVLSFLTGFITCQYSDIDIARVRVRNHAQIMSENHNF